MLALLGLCGHLALMLHFPSILHDHDGAMQDLRARYGDPIVVLNLVKSVEKRPRETILCQEYASAISYINNQARHLICK